MKEINTYVSRWYVLAITGGKVFIMARKVTLSVPESLYQKITDWRASFNLSQMFQDMVTDAIQRKEDFQRRIAEDTNLTEIVKRLKKEKQEAVARIMDSGTREGLRWARMAHYDELCYALSWKPEEESDLLHNKMLGSYFAEYFKAENLSDFFESSGKAARQNINSFISGWKRGVADFWNLIEDKI